MAGKSTNAGFLFNGETGTGREFVSLPQAPSVLTFYIDITGTASLDIEVRDSTKTNFIPVKTITADAIVKISLPASQIAINITSNSGTVTVTWRLVVTENFPNTAIEVFTGGTIEPPEVNVNVTIPSEIEVNNVNEPFETWLKLAQVEIASSPTTIYTVPALTQADIVTIILASTSGSNQVVSLWHDGSSDVNLILPPSTILAGGQAVFSGHILMQPSDTLVADCDAANAVTITVYGKQQVIP